LTNGCFESSRAGEQSETEGLPVGLHRDRTDGKGGKKYRKGMDRFVKNKDATPSYAYDPTNEHFMALRYTCDDPFMIGYETEFGGG
jgi:hypothetical protein